MKTNNKAAVAANTAAAQALGHSPDALAQRKAELLALLAQTAPELMSDNQIDLDKLKDLLEPDRIADPLEHYELSWAGKTAARREIQKTSSHTLRPDPSNPAQAQHMLIEGENLEVLRVLQKSYYGKVKMIYIDPPYNTGNDSFVYPDNYAETLDEYQRRTGEKNEAGFLNKQSLWKKNSKESGQYHSAWLSMMYPRLYLARNLLRDDGVIFISIDDNEAANLKLLCDDVFGAENFVAQLTWKCRAGGGADSKHFASDHEYILCVCKNISQLPNFNLPFSKEQLSRFKLEDRRGKYYLKTLERPEQLGIRANLQYVIEAPDGSSISRKRDDTKYTWVIGEEKFLQFKLDDRIVFKEGRNGWLPYRKLYLQEGDEGEERSTKPRTVLDDIALTREGGASVLELLNSRNLFSYPKPPNLLKHLLTPCTDGCDIVLDFFSGSGTAAHAVVELNLEDGGTRQSISVQMPEVLEEDSEAYKAGYRTIADITRARISKVIAKLKAEHPDKTADLACAHFTLAPSNFKVWRGDAGSADALRDQLALFQRAEKMDSRLRGNDGDLQNAMLAELLLKHGLGVLGVHAISKPMQVAGATVHRVLMPNDKTMWLCFDPYTAALKGEIVKAAPAQVVMLNSCFVGSKADELLSNLQLELAGLEIGLTVI